MTVAPPTITSAPAGEGLPFGTPVTKAFVLGNYEAGSANSTAGDVTTDAYRWKGLQLYQGYQESIKRNAITGITLIWYTRLGTAYESGMISAGTVQNIPAQNSTIDIPFGATNLKLTPLYAKNTYGDLYWIGLRVSYTAANGVNFTQTAHVDAIGAIDDSMPSLSLAKHEVLTGIRSFGASISLDGTSSILGVELQIASFPFSVRYVDVLGPPQQAAVPVRVNDTGNLVTEVVDNSTGVNDLLASLSLSHTYQTSHEVTDTTTIGITDSFEVELTGKVSASVIVTGASAAFTFGVGFSFEKTVTKSQSKLYSDRRIFSTLASVSVPAGKKTQVSLKAYEIDEGAQLTIDATANAIYSWYSYVDGGIVSSLPIATTLRISRIQTTINFIIVQDQLQ